ncbi:MAG TPA: hypothetical protein VGH19_15020 [Verrucomicrobiae bacterium]
MNSPAHKHIIFLTQLNSKIIAHYIELGEPIGEFHQTDTGEIFFNYHQATDRSWYVNKTLAAFRQSAEIFNRFCLQHANDENTDDESIWSLAAAQLQHDLEQIEPLGDPATSLWSTTIYDTEWGLLNLH